MRSTMAFQRTLEHKTLGSFTSNNSRLFSSKKVQVPTLKEYASLALIEQLGSIESVEEFIKQNQGQGLYDCIPSILAKIKRLHRYVLENNLEAADELLGATPEHLLPILLKTKSINTTSAKGVNNYVVVEGTALMMAIGAEAVGRDGCDLCLVPSHSQRENTIPKRLALYSDDNPDSPFRYVVEGKEWTIERGNGEEQLSPDHFNKLKAMFKNPFLYNKNLNLDSLALNEAQRDAYAALLKITEKRKQTLFVNEEGMMELLERHIRRALPGDEGEREIVQQRLAQLPDGWEEKEEKEYIVDREVLLTYRQAIKNSVSNEDPALIAALERYRNHFEPEEKGIKRTGRYGKTHLLSEALEIGDKEYFYDWRKDKLYYDTGVGSLQTLAQDNIRQDMAQGLRQTHELGKKSKRSLEYTYGDGHFVPSGTPRSGVGFDSWVDCYWGAPGRVLGRASPFFEAMWKQKQRYFKNLCRGETRRRQNRVGAF